MESKKAESGNWRSLWSGKGRQCCIHGLEQRVDDEEGVGIIASFPSPRSQGITAVWHLRNFLKEAPVHWPPSHEPKTWRSGWTSHWLLGWQLQEHRWLVGRYKIHPPINVTPGFSAWTIHSACSPVFSLGFIQGDKPKTGLDTSRSRLCKRVGFLFLAFFTPHLWQSEVPRVRVESELQLPAYTTATATQDPSSIWDPHHSLWRCLILNPLSEARVQTCVLVDTSWVHFCWAAVWTPKIGCYIFEERVLWGIFCPLSHVVKMKFHTTL